MLALPSLLLLSLLPTSPCMQQVLPGVVQTVREVAPGVVQTVREVAPAVGRQVLDAAAAGARYLPQVMEHIKGQDLQGKLPELVTAFKELPRPAQISMGAAAMAAGALGARRLMRRKPVEKGVEKETIEIHRFNGLVKLSPWMKASPLEGAFWDEYNYLLARNILEEEQKVEGSVETAIRHVVEELEANTFDTLKLDLSGREEGEPSEEALGSLRQRAFDEASKAYEFLHLLFQGIRTGTYQAPASNSETKILFSRLLQQIYELVAAPSFNNDIDERGEPVAEEKRKALLQQKSEEFFLALAGSVVTNINDNEKLKEIQMLPAGLRARLRAEM